MDIKRFSRKKKDKEDKQRDPKVKDKASKKEKKAGSVTDIVAGLEEVERSQQPKGFFSFGSRRGDRKKYEVETERSGTDEHNTANGFSKPQYAAQIVSTPQVETARPSAEVDDGYRRSLEDRERRNELKRRNSGRGRTNQPPTVMDYHPGYHIGERDVPVPAGSSVQYQQTTPIVIPNTQVGQEIGLKFKTVSNGAQIALGKQEISETVTQAEMNEDFAPVESYPPELNGYIDGLHLELPELIPMQSSGSRELIIRRRPAGDFGFALRRSQIEGNRTGAIHIVEPVGDEISTGLLPGDRLIEVNGKNVESASHETIIDTIARSGDAVTLKVVPMPELAELSSRSIVVEANNNMLGAGSKGVTLVRSGSRRMKKGKAKSDEELVSERAWLEAEKVWVIHSNGFSSGRLLKESQSSDERATCRVKVDQNGDILEVNEDLVEKANPPQYDRAEDLASLRHLNESGCLHTLRQRHGSNLIHTYAGPNLIVVNPKEELGIYTDKVIQMFRGCKQEDMPPHIYAYAQTAYRSMLATRMDQSLVFLGNSGSGKSMNFRHAFHYLTTAAVSPHSSLTAQKVEAALSLLESFGCAKTSLCRNASRYSLLATIEYDPSGLVVGGTLQTYLLEKSRVVQRPFGESNFKIFYELMAGSDDRLRKELHVDALWKEDNNFISTRDVDKEYPRHTDKWLELQFALEVLEINPEEAKGLWAPLAAVAHLGAAGVGVDASGQNFYFANPVAAQLAASVLGTTEEELARVIFVPGFSSSKFRGSDRGRANSSASLRSADGVSGSPSSGSDILNLGPSMDTYVNALEGFVMGLYVEAFTALVRLINRSINTTARIQSSLLLLDTPGFQDPASVLPKSTGASFEDLCYNYACERLNWFLYYSAFTAQMERYDRENIDCNFEMEETVHPDVIISILDRLNVDRRITGQDRMDSKGIFWILEDESMRSSATSETIVDKISSMHMTGKADATVKSGPSTDTFRLSHYQNSRDVLYSTRDWLYKVKEHPTIKMAYTVLAESNKPYVADVYVGHRSGVLQVEIARTRTMRKRSGHGTTLPAVKKNSVCMQIKIQMDSLLEHLRRTGTRFIHCFLPDTSAGTFDIMTHSPTKQMNTLSVPLIRQQFRSANLLEGMRVYRQGYPEYVAYGEFRRRFDILLPRDERETEPVLDEKQAVQRMLEKLDLDKRSYKLGLSQIFLRCGSFAQLEDSRDEKLNATMINFQAQCRGLIGRKRLKIRKVQFLAVTCLQRNIRKFMAVKNWPWWRLYVKVLPLLDVHRTEEELKSKTGEVGTLRAKLEKLEEGKKELKEMNTKLQKKLTEMSATLSEVQSSSNGAQELLDHETSERLRLEEELEGIRNECNKLMKQNEKLETELLEAKIARPVRSSRDRLNDADDYSSDEDSIYKDKYVAATREFEVLRKKLNDQSEEEIQQLQDAKRHVERQLAEEKEESEDLRRTLTNTKRKLARFNGEMEDMKLILETSQGRNAELEKKQRKFDQEMNSLRDLLSDEKANREVMQKERDRLQTERYQLDGDMQDKDEEIARLKRQVERLDFELQDISQVGKTDGNDLMNLKRDKRELEMKVQEQEEELDEQAGRILMLEQAKLKVEMASQKDKQKLHKDLEARDEEVEQLRADYQRKVRQVEEQIEEEHREKSEAVKVRRELERKVFELQRCAEENDQRSEKKLRKELRKLRSLYKDAKYALENQALQATDKNLLKQLRNQLEDTEFAKHIAIKSKKQLEADMMELQKKLDEMTDAKQDAEERSLMLSRDNAELLSKIEEDDDDASDVIKKNRTLVSQIESLQSEHAQHKTSYNALLEEKETLDDRVRQLINKVRYLEENMVDRTDLERAETKIRDMEHKLEIEVSMKIRLENQSNRLKSNIERLQEEKDLALARESRTKQDLIRLERQLKEQKDFTEVIQKQEVDHKRRREETEAQMESLDQTLATMKVELTHANKRIRDLQEALEREMLSSDDDDFLDDDDSEDEATTKRKILSPSSGSISGGRSLRSYEGASPRNRDFDSTTRLERKLSALEDEVRSSRTRLSRSYDSLDDDGYYSRHKDYRKDSASSTTHSIPESDGSLKRTESNRSNEGFLSNR